jgi:hypothetical protein
MPIEGGTMARPPAVRATVNFGVPTLRPGDRRCPSEFGHEVQSPASGEPFVTSERRRAASDQLRQSIQTATVALEVLKLGTVGIDGWTGKVLEQSLVDARNVVQALLTDEK